MNTVTGIFLRYVVIIVLTMLFVSNGFAQADGSGKGNSNNSTMDSQENTSSSSLQMIMRDIRQQQGVSADNQIDCGDVSNSDLERLGEAARSSEMDSDQRALLNRITGGDTQSANPVIVNRIAGAMYLGCLTTRQEPGYDTGMTYGTPGLGTRRPFTLGRMPSASRMGMFVHPIFVYMGVPGGIAGNYSAALTLYQSNDAGAISRDFAALIQATLFRGVGLSFRTLGARNTGYSEIMAHIAPLINQDATSGAGVMAGLEIPTGNTDSEKYGLFLGGSGMYTLMNFVNLNANIGYDFANSLTRVEAASVFQLGSYPLVPMLEFLGQLQAGPTAYLLPALKFRLGSWLNFGTGAQFPLTADQEYDIRALFTVSGVL